MYVAAALTLAAVMTSAPTVEDLAERARRARAEGHLSESLALLREAYAERPLPVLLNNIGRALEELGRYREAADTYRRVVEDPAAERELVERDRARLSALTEKLARAWVQLEERSVYGGLFADDVAIEAKRLPEGRLEIGLAPGAHVLEVTTGRHEVTVRAVTLAPASTSTLALARADDAILELPTLTGTIVQRLEIDGRRLWTPLAEVDRVRVAPGLREVSAELDDGRRLTSRRTLGPGAHLEVVPRTVPSAPKGLDLGPADAPAGGRAMWPWVAGGVGASAVIAGVALHLSASADRAELRDELGAPIVTRVTFAEADAIERGANTKATAGAIALGAGLCALTTALVWWLVD